MLVYLFFSSSETAFTSLNQIRLTGEAKNGDKKAAKAIYLMEHFDRLLSTILIGNNILIIASSAVATDFFCIIVSPLRGHGVYGCHHSSLINIFGKFT